MARCRRHGTIPHLRVWLRPAAGGIVPTGKCAAPRVPQRRHGAPVHDRGEPMAWVWLHLPTAIATGPVLWYIMVAARAVPRFGYGPTSARHLSGTRSKCHEYQ